MLFRSRHFGHAYTTIDQPDYPDFVTDWQTISHPGNLRAVFVGSKYPLGLASLTAMLPQRHRNAPQPPTPARLERVWIEIGAGDSDARRQAMLDDLSLVVHVLEPNSALFQKLRGGPENVVVHAMLVSDHDGMAPFRIVEQSAERSIVMQTTRLDTFIARAGIGEVELLNISLPGTGMEAIRSAGDRLRDIRRITLEVSAPPASTSEVTELQAIVSYLEGRSFTYTEHAPQSPGQPAHLIFTAS